MRDAGHRTPDGEKSKNNISTPQGGGHNKETASVSISNDKYILVKLKTFPSKIKAC